VSGGPRCFAWQNTGTLADINVRNHKNNWGWTPLMIAQGHGPGNFRPASDTIAAIERVRLTASHRSSRSVA
jgi:hypothetical protein